MALQSRGLTVQRIAREKICQIESIARDQSDLIGFVINKPILSNAMLRMIIPKRRHWFAVSKKENGWLVLNSKTSHIVQLDSTTMLKELLEHSVHRENSCVFVVFESKFQSSNSSI